MLSITPTLERVESFTVVGFQTRTQNSDEFHESTAKLPSLWQQFYSSALSTSPTTFGVYSDYEADANHLYTVTVGIVSPDIQATYSAVTVQAGNYLVFQSKGPMPATVIEAWKYVWEYLALKREHQRNFISDFEVYSSFDTVAIYIGVD